ncbi:hypothetical protein OROMI_005086 [Orobanche minor]
MYNQHGQKRQRLSSQSDTIKHIPTIRRAPLPGCFESVQHTITVCDSSGSKMSEAQIVAMLARSKRKKILSDKRLEKSTSKNDGFGLVQHGINLCNSLEPKVSEAQNIAKLARSNRKKILRTKTMKKLLLRNECFASIQDAITLSNNLGPGMSEAQITARKARATRKKVLMNKKITYSGYQKHRFPQGKLEGRGKKNWRQRKNSVISI